ncbi:hypothetical protein K2173_005131 [Erythroxylum novogranatense]|uniref:CCHC-type domain-containing protein n=1 Tax=Erythroxylum novogranatense TaxID=1862640 RepID=A0AAV8TS01_9ROSI|nr:hypothetical protein K2173_005131 [Erythroxylum novogranatense]
MTNSSASSSSLLSLPSIPTMPHQLTVKLTLSNYLLWKTQMMPLLYSQQLVHHIDGTKSPPTEVDNAPNPAYQRWFVKDQMVLGWIFGSLSESVLSQVVGTTTAHGAWSRLQTTFASGSRAQVRTLKNPLYALSRENDSIAVYMDRDKRLFDQLVALDVAISEDDLIDHILRGLGPDYRPFTRNIEAKLVSIKFDDLFGLLLSEELQLNNDRVSITPPAVAHFEGRQNNTVGHRGQGHGNRRAGSSSYAGHGRSNSGYSRPYTPTCFNCHGRGHTNRQCPSPNYSNYTPKPAANYISSPNAQNKLWIVDTGVTHHLTSELENLGIHSEYSGTDEVTLTNG